MHASDSGQVVLMAVMRRAGNGMSGAPHFLPVRDASGSAIEIKKCVLAVLMLRKSCYRCRPAPRVWFVDYLWR